jgi:hypothetical protein
VDAKGCTAAGAKPLTAAIAGPLAKFSPAISPREVATTAISGIPKVGGLISGVVKMFWKNDSSEQLFDAMKSYVDQAVPAAIAKYDSKTLTDDLTAINKLLGEFDDTWGLPSAKAGSLDGLARQLVIMQPRFLNPQSPRSTLAEFVAFATLHLAALKDRYDHFDEYYPLDERDPDRIKNHKHNRDRARSNLNDAIKDYKDHIEMLRNDIIADRLSKLRVNDRGEVHSVFVGVDASEVLIPNDYFSAKDDFCDWQGPEHKDDRRSAQAEVERRRAAVRSAYNKLIDELTKPLAQWKPI